MDSYIGPYPMLPFRPGWTWERWQWKGTPHSPKLQYYWDLIIRLFSVISRIFIGGGMLNPQQKSSRCILQSQPIGLLLGGVLSLCRDAVGVFCSPSGLDKFTSIYFIDKSRALFVLNVSSIFTLNTTWPIKWDAVSSKQRSCRYCCMDAPLGR